MRPRQRLATTVVAGLLASLAAVAAPPSGAQPAVPAAPTRPPGTAAAPLHFEPVGTYDTGLADGSGDVTAGEIVAYENGRAYVINTSSTSLDVLDVGSDGSLSLFRRVDLSAYGAGGNSVAVHGGLVAVALDAPISTDAGTVVLLTRNLHVLAALRVGALPDMVTFTPDGRHLLVANEGEPNADYTIDPAGSVTVIATGSPVVLAILSRLLPPQLLALLGLVRTADFRNVQVPNGVRVFGPGADASRDLEPEYITVGPDGRTAYVTLQENNAIGVLDIRNSRFTRLLPLGLKDHDIDGNGLDPSNDDGAIAIDTWPVLGMYQPDGIASFRHQGQTYLIAANEGDARDYDGFAEEVDVEDAALDPTDFPDADALQADEALGKLNVSVTGDVDGDGQLDQLLAFGGRSISIRRTDGSLVYDSGDALEQLVAEQEPDFFNTSNDSDEFDDRSDNKGPEPEGVAVGEIDGRRYAFVTLERQGGFVVFDITDPTTATPVSWANNRVYGGPEVGPDSGPEGITFIDAAHSPTGGPLLLVGNEVTGTVTAWAVVDADGAGTLTLLHNNDGESSLLPLSYSRPAGVTTGPASVPVGGIGSFATVTDREIDDARAQGNAVVDVYAGDAFLASATLLCSSEPGAPVFDAVAQRLIPYDAHVFGNHEFDFTPDFLERFVREFDTDGDGVPDEPFLSSNLDFSDEPGFADLLDADGLIVGETADGRVVARSSIVFDDDTGHRFGIVGATTPDLPIISSPRDVDVTPDLASTAAAVQAEIDRLTALGVQKVILVSHLQNVANDRALVQLLSDVDIAVAGGGDELLADPADRLPYEAQPIAGQYPLEQADADGDIVYIVTTAGNYKYLGRIDATFDDDGEVVAIDADDSGPVRVLPPSAAATALGITDTAASDPEVEAGVIAPVNACLAELEATPVAGSEVTLDTSNPGQRTRENNTGNNIVDGFVSTYLTHAESQGLPGRTPANPVAGFTNGGGIRQNAGNSLPNDGNLPGILSRLDVVNVLPFDNFLVVMPDVPASALQQAFDFAAQGLGPNSGPVLANGRFLQVSGFEVVYRRAAAAAGNEVEQLTYTGDPSTDVDDVDLVVGGALVAGAPAIDVVTNSFTAGGGDGYAMLGVLPSVRVRDAGGSLISYEQAWREYLLTFPPATVVGQVVPTIPATDGRYALPTGEGRILIDPPPPGP